MASTTFDSDAHVITKRMEIALRILLAVFAAASIIGLFFFRTHAYLAAIPIPVLFVVLLIVRHLERGSRKERRLGRDQSDVDQEEVELDKDAVGLLLILELGGTLALAAVVVAASFYQWQMVGVSAAALFILAILIGLPYWHLMVADARAAEEEKHTRNKQNRPN